MTYEYYLPTISDTLEATLRTVEYVTAVWRARRGRAAPSRVPVERGKRARGYPRREREEVGEVFDVPRGAEAADSVKLVACFWDSR